MTAEVIIDDHHLGTAPAVNTLAPAGCSASLSDVVPIDLDTTPVTSQTEQLLKEAGPALQMLLDTILDKADQAESLEALRDELLNSYDDLDNSELVKVMTMGFAAVDLAGRFDVSKGG